MTDEGREYEDVVMDEVRIGAEKHSSSVLSCDYKIVYKQLAV